ncbi:glycosyltransferase family 2 protein [Thalassovita sp.]|uniref:glycosyltransferase family 2 protein n=1 Tax=Thalassovita sp. TaxID=1979401 RepID=UPI0029DE6843|nr:glycosyltransferase family 2 protein [Thalassovita sp.]
MTLPTWGIVSTIKAPVREILNFCAHHLELGAHRLYIYLDNDNREAFTLLSEHPNILPVLCDDAYWATVGRRPGKHQARQVANAAHAYARAPEVDWLAHIDVDEFLWTSAPLPSQLAALPGDCVVARIRPAEALASPEPGPVTHFKRLTIDRAKRDSQTRRIYPTFGMHLNGGFLSHVQGKLIYRTGIPSLTAKIHNVNVGDMMNPGQQELAGTELLHLHAKSWEDFIAAFRFRIARGSYRSELKPATQNGVSMHDLFTMIHNEAGEDGLRAFYAEVCTASPDLLNRLQAEGLLSCHALNLDPKRAKQFFSA